MPPVPYTDQIAAVKLTELREARGLSCEGLAQAIKLYAKEQGWYKVHGAVDAYTIRRIEEDFHYPGVRVRLVIALYFGLGPRDIWQPSNRRQRLRQAA